MKQNIREALAKEKLVFDGAFGTYYALKYDTEELPETANERCPERVLEIHGEYLEAGAQILRTNTYASNTAALHVSLDRVRENVRLGYQNACKAVKISGKEAYVAADIGPIAYQNMEEKESARQEYIAICQTFLEEGAGLFVFETFSNLEDILPAIESIADRAFVVVQFCVNQFGYSNAGLSARKLLEEAVNCDKIDAAGFNCGVGPGHMQRILKGVSHNKRLFLTALPNAGYPQNISNRMIFANQNVAYFASKVCDIARDGADMVGGCCGTTPEHIRLIGKDIERRQIARAVCVTEADGERQQTGNNAFYAKKKDGKLIAVELAPPLGSDDEKLMEAAHLLQKSGVDVLTFPDSPSGRTRADSVLMAEKVWRETGIPVMPHICCRDKNAIAMRSQLLGAHINSIYNFLVITGDPIPTMVRSSVKSVFNFDSVGLMKIMADMNEDQFAEAPICYGGAINQTRRNLDVEIGRVRKKMEAGATFFLTQPVSTREGAERVHRIKEETGARILCGVMPFVSLKNAVFMKNEMTGIEVSEEVLTRYRENMTREEGEQAGVLLAKDVIDWTKDFVDGYYFSFPFNRVGMLERILQE